MSSLIYKMIGKHDLSSEIDSHFHAFVVIAQAEGRPAPGRHFSYF